MRYITTASLNGLKIDVGSDWHLPPSNADLLAGFKERIVSEKGSSILFCVGDIIETSDGLDSSRLIVKLLNELATVYRGVIFVPGNHDLRGRQEPWNDFQDNLSPNVFTTGAFDPRLLDLHDIDPDFPSTKVLLTNFFYDMKFLDPAILDLTPEAVLRYYQDETNDGKHFLNGKVEMFVEMAEIARAWIKPEIDILVSHALPHPSLVTFRVGEKTEEHVRREAELGIPFICDPEYDAKQGARWNDTAEGYRKFWNFKSFFMGSDVLSETNFKDGLVCVYGHNHRSNDKPMKLNGKTVNFVSHQPCPWTTNYQ